MSEQNTKDQKTEERSVDGRAVGHQIKKSRFYAVMRSIFARIMLGLFRVEIVDAENEPQDSGGFIVCSNHISAADPILIVASLRNQVHFVAKAELFHVPLLGLIIRAFGAYPIKRGAADVGAIKRTVELLRGGERELVCLASFLDLRPRVPESEWFRSRPARMCFRSRLSTAK